MMLSAWESKALVEGEHEDVFGVLGPHVVQLQGGPGVVVRALLPDADAARVVPLGSSREPRAMERVHPAGLFEAVFADQHELFAYRLQVTDGEGAAVEIEDAYRFPSTLSEYDRHLLAEGTHENAADKLGAHPTVLDGVAGTTFALWAPNARDGVRTTAPWPSTRCTSARGGACRRTGIGSSPTVSWPSSWGPTCARWASRTWSCCR